MRMISTTRRPITPAQLPSAVEPAEDCVVGSRLPRPQLIPNAGACSP
jgi:hypothetical protein